MKTTINALLFSFIFILICILLGLVGYAFWKNSSSYDWQIIIGVAIVAVIIAHIKHRLLK